MVHVDDGLKLDVERGPNWLIVKMRSDEPIDEVPHLAEELWSISARHFIYRLVLELDELESLPDDLMDQLALLQERLEQCGGALRLCGLTSECEEALCSSCQFASALPNHATLVEAVMGSSEESLIAH
jgi:hypothetical protein